MSGPDFELQGVELPFTVASMDPTTVSQDEVARDGGILMPGQAAGDPPVFIPEDELWHPNRELWAAGIDLVGGPVVALLEAYEGVDFAGRELSGWERAFNVVASVPVPGAHAAKILHVLHTMHEVAEVVHTGKHAIHLGEVLLHGEEGGEAETEQRPDHLGQDILDRHGHGGE